MFDVPLKPVTVDEGEKLSLRCHVCGSPPLKIQWMKDRKDLTSGGSTRISFSDGTACLEISPASKHDAGDYLCKATNDAGSEFCKAKVTVKGRNSETCCYLKISVKITALNLRYQTAPPGGLFKSRRVCVKEFCSVVVVLPDLTSALLDILLMT